MTMPDQNDEDFNEALENLFSKLNKAIGGSLDRIMDSLDPKASNEDLIGEFLKKTFQAKTDKVAKDFNKTEIGVIMLLSGYLLDPGMKEISSYSLFRAVGEVKGIEAIMADMRSNGVEVTYEQVAEAIDSVMSYVIEFGLASLHQGLLSQGIDCSPPKADKTGFGDIGIEDPFKDSPEA